jgi:hypothetical protein
MVQGTACFFREVCIPTNPVDTFHVPFRVPGSPAGTVGNGDRTALVREGSDDFTGHYRMRAHGLLGRDCLEEVWLDEDTGTGRNESRETSH